MRKELILFGIVALIVASYFLFSGVKDVVINNQTPTPGQYAGWNTYTNEEYGFSIEYPNDWQTKGDDDNNEFYSVKFIAENSENYIYIHIARKFSTQTDPTVAETIEEFKKYGYLRSNQEQGVFTQIPLAGATAIKAHSVDMELNKYVEIYIPHQSKNYILSIIYPDHDEFGEGFDTIVKTLRLF